MVAYYVNDIVERLSKAPEIGMWEVRFASPRIIVFARPSDSPKLTILVPALFST